MEIGCRVGPTAVDILGYEAIVSVLTGFAKSFVLPTRPQPRFPHKFVVLDLRRRLRKIRLRRGSVGQKARPSQPLKWSERTGARPEISTRKISEWGQKISLVYVC